jgi:hypothetical protein
MARWALTCKHCGLTFEHSRIPDTFVNFFFPEKPQFPSKGLEFECTHCKKRAIYGAVDLRFQSERAFGQS